MRFDEEDWLDQKIMKDLLAMADEEEKRLMESEELENLHMPEEKLEEIHRWIREHKEAGSGRIPHFCAVFAAAAATVFLLGAGLVDISHRPYQPVSDKSETLCDFESLSDGYNQK